MPTIKQIKAAKAVVGNGGNVTKAMIAVGYSVNTANTPKKLTESDGWKELMQKHLDDRKLAKKHEQLLNDDKSEIQIKALDLAYKVKGKVQDEKPQAVHITNVNFFSNPDIIEATKNLDETIIKHIKNEAKKSGEVLQDEQELGNS